VSRKNFAGGRMSATLVKHRRSNEAVVLLLIVYYFELGASSGAWCLVAQKIKITSKL